MKKIPIDKPLVVLTAFLLIVGFFVFTSASFGLFARGGGSSLGALLGDQIIGIFLGVALFVVALRVPLRWYRNHALHIMIFSAVVTLLVFVPHIGMAHGGAHRWIDLRFITFQPSELLKLGTVIYFAALLPLMKGRLGNLGTMLGVLGAVIGVPAMLLLAEPDTGTLAVLLFAMIAMLIVAGARIRHILLLFILCVVAVGVLAMVKPYVEERIRTFLDPSRDPQGASYQIQKSLMAIGSGGITGRGFGQSLQKFGSLPEPTGDSIFAIAGEEFGFVGGVIIIILFLFFSIRGLHIARNSEDAFSGLLSVGIVILIVSQSFANIAAMLGLIPLTGVPLVFVSHGGTALLFAFIEIGILLNVSKQIKS